MVATNSSFTQRDFLWDDRRTKAAMMLAEGETKTAVSETLEIDRVTLYHWLEHPDFAAEVDRLSLMMHISSRAERLRIAMRVAKARTQGEVPETEKDLLDWLKFAQSETDGAKIDLSKLAELLAGESGGSGPAMKQLTTAIDVTASGSGDEQLQAQDVGGPDDALNPS